MAGIGKTGSPHQLPIAGVRANRIPDPSDEEVFVATRFHAQQVQRAIVFTECQQELARSRIVGPDTQKEVPGQRWTVRIVRLR